MTDLWDGHEKLGMQSLSPDNRSSRYCHPTALFLLVIAKTTLSFPPLQRPPLQTQIFVRQWPEPRALCLWQ
jgi:hypothetical protein